VPERRVNPIDVRSADETINLPHSGQAKSWREDE
jgi:hypothetical protein